jgi:hypothetical protein
VTVKTGRCTGVTAEFEDSVNDLCIFGCNISSQGEEGGTGRRLFRTSDMPKDDDNEKVHMKLDQYMTGLLVSLDPSYKEFVNEEGTCLVQVVKGLYGLIEAAKLWYNKLSGLLTSLGFTPNNYDPCVFNQQDTVGQTTLTVYMDYVMIAAPLELEEHYSGHG